MPDEVVDSSQWEKFFLPAVTSASAPVEAQVVTHSKDVEKYWKTLEFGSREGHKPWPQPRKKTIRGRSDRIVSKQAPEGFVRKNAKRFADFLKDAYVKKVATLKRPLSHSEIAAAANEAAENALATMKSQIPVDSGLAKNSMEVRRAK